MSKAQQRIVSGGYLPHQIVNLDETAVNWGLGPTHVYCAQNADRGEQEITDEKARVTAILMVAANGEFLPIFYIFKHSKSSENSPDQTRMSVITSLQKKQGFKQENGWELYIWERMMTIKNKQKISITSQHRVRYLKHRVTGHIITSQYKAWNDSIRMAMCIDLILKPESEKRGNKLFLWQDNFSAHKTSCLDSIYSEANIETDYLPPNMTYILQVIIFNIEIKIMYSTIMNIGIGPCGEWPRKSSYSTPESLKDL